MGEILSSSLLIMKYQIYCTLTVVELSAIVKTIQGSWDYNNPT